MKLLRKIRETTLSFILVTLVNIVESDIIRISIEKLVQNDNNRALKDIE